MYEEIFERVKVGLGVENLESGDELLPLKQFWASLMLLVEGRPENAYTAVLLEEALGVWMLSHRLLFKLAKEKEIICEATENKKGELIDQNGKKIAKISAGKVLPGVEAWLKMRERLRRVMKELLSQYGLADESGTKSLAEMMGPILEMGKGVLEDVMECESDGEERKDADRKGDDD